MSLFGRILKCVRLVNLWCMYVCTSCGIWRILLRNFFDDFESDIDVCNVNNVDSDHGDPVIVHLRCLCDFSLFRFEKDDLSVAGSFRRYAAILLIGSPSVLRLVYLFWGILLICTMVTLLLIREHLFVKGVCYPRVLIFLHTKRTFHLAIWSVNDSHFVNYGMIFVFRRIGVVYKSNYNLKTNRHNWINVLLG